MRQPIRGVVTLKKKHIPGCYLNSSARRHLISIRTRRVGLNKAVKEYLVGISSIAALILSCAYQHMVHYARCIRTDGGALTQTVSLSGLGITG